MMWIEISKDVFEKADRKGLNYIFQILSWYPINSVCRYNFFVDTKDVRNTDNYIFLDTIEEDFTNTLDSFFNDFVNQSNDSSKSDYKVTYKKGKNNFNIEESIFFFNQPVSIILENNKNDSQFIKAILNHFDEKNKLNEHLKNNWIKFENAGGCSNLPNFIEGFLNQFRELAIKNNRNLSDYFRGIIILDSDKDFPSQETKHKSLIEKISKFLSENDVHILEKRAMENYLPIEVYKELLSQDIIRNYKNNILKDWIDAFLNLTDEQQDFINISSGFPPNDDKYNADKIRKEVNIEILNFFNLDISDINFQKLDMGFKFPGFFNSSKLNTSLDFKNEFPNLFKKSIVTKESLERRDRIGELKDIYLKINKLI
jgi:hypothetical protein